MRIFKGYLIVIVLFLFWAMPNYAQAQMFDGEYPKLSPEASSPAKVPDTTKDQKAPGDSILLPPPETFFIPKPDIPQVQRPTLDGVKRGTASMRPIISDDPNAAKDDELIFLYYKDFSVERMMSGRVSCNVTFVIMTTLSRKLSNLSVKLVWPGLTTSISFDDVVPNTETVYPYTLMGDGCFTMDKTPNIVVNRCRVKDVNQSDCAGKIRWITKK